MTWSENFFQAVCTRVIILARSLHHQQTRCHPSSRKMGPLLTFLGLLAFLSFACYRLFVCLIICVLRPFNVHLGFTALRDKKVMSSRMAWYWWTVLCHDVDYIYKVGPQLRSTRHCTSCGPNAVNHVAENDVVSHFRWLFHYAIMSILCVTSKLWILFT